MKYVILICIVILGIVWYSGESNSINVSQNGISVYELADRVIHKYDLDSNKVIDVPKESFLRTQLDNVNKVESRGLLFSDADSFGNNDGLVEILELIDYIDEFDEDGDGEITSYKNIFHSIANGASEMTLFERKYTEKFKYSKIEWGKSFLKQAILIEEYLSLISSNECK